mgnify:FL=1|tara:strand:- start:236 stop:688 length:453 start_codon:yes stop_codon:yes gene_type:complete
MKTFKGFMREGSGFPTSSAAEPSSNLGGSTEVNPSSLGNPEVVKRLNAIVGQIGNGEYLLPEHALNRLRGSLQKIGLSFAAIPTMEGKSGSFDLKLELFGGRFGKDSNTPFDEFLDDDGISHMVEGGLSLKINYEMMPTNNSCRVFASIS